MQIPWVHLLAVLGLSLACALWIVVQRFVARKDPGQPGVEGSTRCGHAPGPESCEGCGEQGCGGNPKT
jgi:hypothetical protein